MEDCSSVDSGDNAGKATNMDDIRSMRGSLSERLRRMSTASIEPTERVDATYAFGNRPRAKSFVSRGSSVRSSAVSAYAQLSDSHASTPGGILLNTRRGSGQGDKVQDVPIPRRQSRRMTRSSAISLHSLDNQSEAGTGDESDTREDVFYLVSGDLDDGIDFEELDVFRDTAQQGQTVGTSSPTVQLPTTERITSESPAQRNHTKLYSHRPLVPQQMATESTGTASIDVPILDGSKAGLYDESEVQFEKGRVYSRERFSFFASEFEDTIHAPHLSGLVDKGQSFSELFDEANGTWWLDCMDPTDDEMRIISRAFGIHPLTIEDITTEESREKVELFTHYYFVCFHTFDQDKESEEFLEPVNMYFVVFRAGILSFHFSPVPHTASVRKRICQLRDYVAVSADWICYALIDDITDSFAPIIREIEEEADIVEDSVYVARDDDFVGLLRRIGESRRKVMTLMRLLSGKADVIKMFAKRCQKNWDNAPKGEIGLYLGDIQDHIFTMHQNLSVYERIFARSHGNYMAQLQVESIAGNNRVTKMLGKVTVLGTLFLPMNLITGLFGMNVTVPGEQQGNLKWWLGILFFIVGIGVIVFFVCNRFFLDDDAASRIGSSSSVSFKSSAISRLAGGSRRSQANPRLEIRD